MDPFAALPSEISIHTLQLLTPKEVLMISATSKLVRVDFSTSLGVSNFGKVA